MDKKHEVKSITGQRYTPAQAAEFAEYWAILQKSGGFRETIKLEDITPLPVPVVLPNFTWNLTEVAGVGSITFSNCSDGLANFFEMSGCERIAGGFVVGPGKARELPHDFCHYCLSQIPQGMFRIPGTNLTPDIVRNTMTGYEAIEVATTRRDTVDGLSTSVGTKVSSYHHLYRSGVIKRFNVCCVSISHVRDLTGILGDEYDCLRAAYALGLQIYRRYDSLYGAKLDLPDSRVSAGVLESVMNIPRITIDTDFDDEFFAKTDPSNYTPIIGLSEYKVKLGKFTDYESAQSAVDARPIGASLVHVPMVIPKQDTAKLDLDRSKGANVYSRIFNSCIEPLSLQHNKTFEVLASESAFYADESTTEKAQRKRFTKKQAESNDFCEFIIDHNAAIELATRGVNAKAYSADPVISLRQSERHKPYAWADRSQFDFLSDYYEREVEFVKGRHFDPVDVDFQQLNGMPDLSDCFSQAQGIPELQAALFLSCVAAEISANVKRHTSCDKSKYKLIVRRLFGWRAFLVLRTTSYGENSNFQYAVFFQGQEICDGLYEKVEELDNKWSYCKFVTLDRDKLSHLQGLFGRTMAMLGFLANTISEPLSHDSNVDDLYKAMPALRCFLSIDVADDAQLCETLQLLRFYYGNLMSGIKGCKEVAESIISDVPMHLRSGLTMHFIQQLIDLHACLPDDLHLRMHTVVRQSDDPGDQGFSELAENVLDDGIDCPFRFKLYSADQVLVAIYACMLRNKDEGDAGYGSKVIMEKLLKGEYLSISLRKGQSAIDFHQKMTSDPDDLGKFQYSRPALSYGASLLRAHLAKNAGFARWDEHDIDLLINEQVASRLSKQFVQDAATTRASTVPYDPELSIEVATTAASKEDQEEALSSIGVRRKCIFQVLEAINKGVLKKPIIAENSEFIVDQLLIKEKGLQVTLFKKNQITGVREIYVLTMAGRLFMRTYNDVARAICSMIPEEMLTHPELKDGFVAKHYKNVQSSAQKYGMTHAVRFRWSGDMTQWANLFCLLDHAAFLSELLPSTYKNMIHTAGHLLRRKHVQIPRKTIEHWISSYATYVETGELEHVKKLEAEFKRHKVPCEILRGPQKVVMKILTNMMQGIPHYVSSLYHVAHLLHLKEMLQSWASTRGVVCVMDFEVSSDDEGMMITLMTQDKQILHKVVPEFIAKWSRIKNSVDVLWGIRTSAKKSVLSVADWFEFNSKFFVKNTVVSALIKFVTRSCDDQPEQSLHDRVSTLLTSLAAVRDNGGSGYLCHWISMCQQQSFLFSLGHTWCSWFTDDVYSRITKDKLTHQGYFPVLPAHLAGLINCDYINWIAAKDRDARVVLQSLMGQSYSSEPVDDTHDYAHRLNYGLFPTDKYKKALESAGIDYSVDSVVRESDIRLLICGTDTIGQTARVCKLRACTVGIARSMAHLTRSDVLCVGVFLLWAAVYKTKDGKTHMMRARDKLLESFKGEPLPRESLFPLHIGFASVNAWTEVTMRCGRTGGSRRLRPSVVNPLASVSDHHASIKRLLKHAWFGESSGFPARVTASLWSAVTKDIPYLVASTEKENGPALTMAHPMCPAKDLKQLLGFIEDYSSVPRPRKLLMRGHAAASSTSVEALICRNSSDVYDYFTDGLPDHYDDEEQIVPSADSRAQSRAVEDYLRGWVDLAYSSDAGHSVVELMNEDLKHVSGTISKSMWSSLDGQKTSKYGIAKLMGFVSGNLSFSELCHTTGSTEVFLKRPAWDGKTFSGPQEKIVFTEYGAGYGKTDGKNWHTQGNIPRNIMNRHFPPALTHSNANYSPTASDYRFLRLSWLDESIWIVLKSPGGMAWMQMPKLSMHSEHFRGDKTPSTLWECWLERTAPNPDELAGMFTSIYNEPSVSKSMSLGVLKYAKRMKNQRTTTEPSTAKAVAKAAGDLSAHMDSRLKTFEKTPKDLETPDLLVGDNWADFQEAEDTRKAAKEESLTQEFIDCYTVAIETKAHWSDSEFRGFRVHAFEYQEAARQFNPCLRAVDDAMNKLRGLGKAFLSEEAKKLLALYDTVD